jgi:1,4-dihydroxy-2-naphthoyl-CoA hydrolase
VSEAAPRPSLPAPSPFDAFYGLELLSVSDEEVRARVRVADHHLQPAGAVHGGVVAAMAESMASVATHRAVVSDGMVAAGLSNHASFVRPVTGTLIEGIARCRHRGRGTWVWEAEFSDDAGRLCALVRVTVAVRPGRGSAPPG